MIGLVKDYLTNKYQQKKKNKVLETAVRCGV